MKQLQPYYVVFLCLVFIFNFNLNVKVLKVVENLSTKNWRSSLKLLPKGLRGFGAIPNDAFPTRPPFSLQHSSI